MEELTGYNLPEGSYWVKKVQQDEKGTLIVLESKQFMVKILFAGFVYAMLCSDESGLQKRNHQWLEKFAEVSLIDVAFFKLTDSKFIDYIKDQTFGYYEDFDFKHFVAWTEDNIIEIIAHYEPEIEIQEKK
ncbi:hypothetical protein [Enterococcus malodoratus]|uniref:Uncharacterized protein n=1 Tax=Enterococcus malodoratus ATCC 43197 TaxID=1158601 RepID=R2QTD0_9ENTE|nr:hypothetical protein [Enterococcus malodoratus]EOH71876.1 hypothetical protein UAI_04160 [Enterococcus malodoratus ATCC 43197]EOT70100.1 hypothetical protein I585_01579 [Enterococcus malodoratus ATCC 43197]OJG66303.1 hypothetical protein RV07_GL000096 [Enterococcus malodoratus]SPW74777.1 Uncharacterised protein [Enterococcus malodoratus]STD65311.1 Uncharacterised protein [Enterococcus malodoratus]